MTLDEMKALKAKIDSQLQAMGQLPNTPPTKSPEAHFDQITESLESEPVEQDFEAIDFADAGGPLKNHVANYKSARTINDLEGQMHLARQMGCDSFEATPNVIKHYCRNNIGQVEKVGYFMYKGIRVYFEGRTDEFIKKESEDTLTKRIYPNGQ